MCQVLSITERLLEREFQVPSSLDNRTTVRALFASVGHDNNENRLNLFHIKCYKVILPKSIPKQVCQLILDDN